MSEEVPRVRLSGYAETDTQPEMGQREIFLPVTPTYNIAPYEMLPLGPNANCRIVFGKDRPGHEMSGCSSFGADTDAYQIDIVVGALGSKKIDAIAQSVEPDANFPSGRRIREIGCDPSTQLDAARIRISQKSGMDEDYDFSSSDSLHFGLRTTKANPRSMIGMCADGVRIISKDAGVKIVTGYGFVNSKNLKSDQTSKFGRGIDLVGNQDFDGLEPLVKGHKLVEYLQGINNSIKNITGIVENVVQSQINLVQVLAYHSHLETVPGSLTFPSAELVIAGWVSSLQSMYNEVFPLYLTRLEQFQRDFELLAGKKNFEQSILSSHNRTN